MSLPVYSYRDDPSVPPFADDQPILVFDGKCVLCSATVQFIFAHDRERRVRFVVAQSPLGTALYRHFGLKSEDYETNIVLENGPDAVGEFNTHFRTRWLAVVADVGFPDPAVLCEGSDL